MPFVARPGEKRFDGVTGLTAQAGSTATPKPLAAWCTRSSRLSNLSPAIAVLSGESVLQLSKRQSGCRCATQIATPCPAHARVIR